MEVQELGGGWIRKGSVIAFPYGWQRPAKTEEWVYETLIQENIKSLYIEFIAFPWATLIDLIDRNKVEKVKYYLDALRKLPIKKSLIRATACQHIRFKSIENFLTDAGVTDLFASHKVIDCDHMTTIRLHPMSLYPVSFFEFELSGCKKLTKKRYLYSFVGAYDEYCYISDIRKIIFNKKHTDEAIVKKRGSWHFDLNVYKNQIESVDLSEEEMHLLKTYADEYREILSNSVYSLCPSGSGPNSIRFWESIAFGVIPILLSDHLDVPYLPSWIKFHRVKESDFYDFINKISEIEISLEYQKISLDNVAEIFLFNILNIFKDKAALLDLMRRPVGDKNY